MEPVPRRLEIEILTAREPLRGRLLLGGDALPFTGWLDLLAALQQHVSALAIGEEAAERAHVAGE